MTAIREPTRRQAIRDHLGYLLLGLGAGAVYAALGLGLVLVHRASGVVSVAHGALAMYVTYVHAELRATGDLVLPLGRVPLGHRPGAPEALAEALVVAALLGYLLHLLVFRPLRHAPPLARLVASVGLLVALQALAAVQFGSGSRTLPAVLPDGPVSLLGVEVPADRLLLAGGVVACSLALAAVYRWTPFGLATRAGAEDEASLALLGRSPDRLAALNWAASGVLAGLAGILVAPLTSLNPLTSSLFVVPALAAAVVGRLEGFVVTALAALALGAAQSEVVRLQADASWLRDLNLRDGLPFLVVVVVMVVRGRLVPDRGTTVTSRLPAVGPAPGAWTTTAALVVPLVVAMVLLTGSWRLGLIRSVIGALVCLSFVVLTGWVGQVSLAQMALAGVGGFLLGRLHTSLHLPFPVAPLVAASCAAVVGLVVGLAARRVRGVDLAVVTLAAGVAVEELVFKNAAVTGGLGGSSVPPPTAFGVDLGIAGTGEEYPRLAFGLLAVVVLAAALLAVAHVRRSAQGLRMLAVRVDERAAEAVGVDAARTKLVAFVLAAFLAGLAGALLGYAQGQLSFGSFEVFASLSFLAAAYLGGVTRLSGALVGGLLVPGGLAFTVLDRVDALAHHEGLVSGVGLVVVAVLAPEGLTGLVRRRRP